MILVHILSVLDFKDKILLTKIWEKFFKITSKKKQYRFFLILTRHHVLLRSLGVFLKGFFEIFWNLYQIDSDKRKVMIIEKRDYKKKKKCLGLRLSCLKFTFLINKKINHMIFKNQFQLNAPILFFFESLRTFLMTNFFFQSKVWGIKSEKDPIINSRILKKKLFFNKIALKPGKKFKKLISKKKNSNINLKKRVIYPYVLKILDFFCFLNLKKLRKLWPLLKESGSTGLFNIQFGKKNKFKYFNKLFSFYSESVTFIHEIFSFKVSWSLKHKKTNDYSRKIFLNVGLKGKNFLYVNGSVYLKLKILGKGGSGKVYKILRNDGKIFALKKNKVEKFTIDIIHNFVNEIVVLKFLSRKSKIIRIEDAEVSFKKQIICIILEFGEYDLETFFAQKKYNLDFYQVKVFWKQILEAVKEIHDERIVHGDLKPSNFLFIEKNLKLIDFGISKPIGNNTTNITRDIHIGTINYMSPEAILEIPGILENIPKFKTSRSSDVWSLGCILFQLSHGCPPFKNFSIIQKIHAIINDSLRIRYISDFPPILIDVIKNCLRRHPDFRPTVDELSCHPFINYSGKFSKHEYI